MDSAYCKVWLSRNQVRLNDHRTDVSDLQTLFTNMTIWTDIITATRLNPFISNTVWYAHRVNNPGRSFNTTHVHICYTFPINKT